MTQLSTPAETLAAQEACARAWEESRLRNGFDRMKLIYKAFPHAVNAGETKGGLRLTWIEEFNAFGVSDAGGFLTLVGDEDDANAERTLHQLFRLLSSESKNPGAVRELITGAPRPELLETSQVPKILETSQVPKIPSKEKLTLDDLGLGEKL